MSAPLPSSPLPARLAASVWRATDLASSSGPVLRSGWERLDAELPGGGWPCGSLNEIVLPQLASLEWRLLGPALRGALRGGAKLVLAGPPALPHLPGLQCQGIDPAQLVWVRSRDAGESLRSARQVLRAGGAAALLVWLPACRADALRRLHADTQGARALVFALRPQQARAEASPAPLRVQARPGSPWELRVQVFKRRGPAHDAELSLPALPGGLGQALPEAARPPAGDGAPAGADHAVGRIAGLRLA